MTETRKQRLPDTARFTGARLLIVDDEPLIRETLAEYLSHERFDVSMCRDGEEAVARTAEQRFDIVLCDVQLPGIDGLGVLEHVLKVSPETSVLLITAYGTVESAVAAFQRGAHDYLMKPILLDEVLAKIRRLLEYRELAVDNQRLRRELSRATPPDQIVGKSAAMRRVMELVRKVGGTRSNVLLMGESGTGKELIARALHQQGSNPNARLLAVNCAAIPHDLLENQLFGHRKGAFTGADRDQDGVFAHAGTGTVFLDEISELSLATQAKLLRAIEQKEVMPVGANEPIRVDARVIAATNKDLPREVEAGRFRQDLFYRLNVVTITLPPLRERREDIPDLVEFLLARQARQLGKRIHGVTHETMLLLRASRWKGNIRELENVLQRAAILTEATLITPADLPPDLVPVTDDPALVEELAEAVSRFERNHIERMLQQCSDKKDAARRLGMSLSSLYRKITELGIRTTDEREQATR
jgi:DNA-binding NtrC family response regulator